MLAVVLDHAFDAVRAALLVVTDDIGPQPHVLKQLPSEREREASAERQHEESLGRARFVIAGWCAGLAARNRGRDVGSLADPYASFVAVQTGSHEPWAVNSLPPSDCSHALRPEA